PASDRQSEIGTPATPRPCTLCHQADNRAIEGSLAAWGCVVRKLILGGIACVALAAAPALAADLPVKGIIYKAPPPLVFTPRIHIGLFFGGSWITDLPTSSSSGFYVGNANNASSSLIVGSIFVDLAQFGDPRVLFGSWVLSAGLVVDSMRFGSINWSGRCGVAPCVGTGSLNELNVVPELKVMTALTPNFKVGAYVGFGMS